MRVFNGIILLFIITMNVTAQDGFFRGSIPEALLRPGWGESPRYPIDTVIGELGQGRASAGAFSFANSVLSGLLQGQASHQGLASINSALRESYLSELRNINPNSYRLGGGREEADGAVSFLVRFIGREYGMTGELFIRYVTRLIQGADGEYTTTGNWVFEELILEDAKSRDVQQQSLNRFDFSPYERIY